MQRFAGLSTRLRDSLLVLAFIFLMGVTDGWAQQSIEPNPIISSKAVPAEVGFSFQPGVPPLPQLELEPIELELTLTKQSPSRPSPSPALSAAQLEELKAIRAQIQAQMGGGVAEQFKSIPGYESVADEFDAELQKIAGRSTPAPLPMVASKNGEPIVNPVVAGVKPKVTQFNSPAVSANPKIAALRSAARHLDAAAADLEDVGLYADADAMRVRANRLRMEARK